MDANIFEEAGRYFYVLPKKELTFDWAKRRTKFGENCSGCGQPSHVIGITPAYLTDEITKSGLYATDLHFGDVEDSGKNLTPGIILTEDIMKKMIDLQPSGLDYEQTHC